ncbi:nucleotidyltransferase domain protein, partial [Ancylostoma ceylanicum]
MHTPHIPKETEDVVRIIKEITGQPVAGIYLYGSAICGGLRQDSDIDILVSGAIGNQQLIRPLEITMVNKEELSPWQHPVSSELQYGEWLRDDFLKGQLPDSTPDPDLTILLRQVRQNSVTLVGTNAQELIPDIPDKDVKQAISDALPTLLKSIEGDERNTLLTLAR